MRSWLAGSMLVFMGAIYVHAQNPAENSATNSVPRASMPAATLGLPRAVADDADPPPARPFREQPSVPIRLVSHDLSAPAEAIIRMQIGDMDPHSPFVPPELDPPSYPENRGPSRPNNDSSLHQANFGEWFNDFGQRCSTFFGRSNWFQSDPDFCNLISPITNPFLFEDPRSLTEIRPIFIFQTIPTGNPAFNGGTAEFFGTQLRLAITDRVSFTINKLGWTWINPGSGATEPGGNGFSELHLGPKFTFWRDPDHQIVAAAGLIFQIPAGNGAVYQDTGSLSLVPYITGAVNFYQSSWGSFNAMGAVGFSFPTDNERSAFFYNSWHLDWDVMNWHRVWPTLEMNWFVYTHSGNFRPVNAEGLDLANIGSTAVGGMGNLTIAPGVRVGLTQHAQLGVAAEFPLVQGPVIQQFRLVVDLIWRY
ncbi:MAG TPA: hypothetical protein VGZ47_13330 [Gemmataceae bacterium]|nr:hypothetical protein [Gemmataceae bacterium]